MYGVGLVCIPACMNYAHVLIASHAYIVYIMMAINMMFFVLSNRLSHMSWYGFTLQYTRTAPGWGGLGQINARDVSLEWVSFSGILVSQWVLILAVLVCQWVLMLPIMVYQFILPT